VQTMRIGGLGAIAVALLVVGCGSEAPTSRPAVRPPTSGGPGLPAADTLIQVSARIDPAVTVEGFPETLVVELALDPAGDLHWNNDANAKPPAITLTVPEGVRLSRTTAVMPNTALEHDVVPRVTRIGLAEETAAGTDWRLGVQLEAFVCRDEGRVCLRQQETHEVTLVRGP